MMNYGSNPVLAVISILFYLLILVGIIMLIIWAIRQFSASVSTHTQSSLEMLKIRYAKGEINKEQFEEMRKALEDKGQ